MADARQIAANQPLEPYMRYHAAQDRAYQRASAELQKPKKSRQLAEIGFGSQKCAEAEESRKIEKHATQIATAASFHGEKGSSAPPTRKIATVMSSCWGAPAAKS